jgi:hypothetical protein
MKPLFRAAAMVGLFALCVSTAAAQWPDYRDPRAPRTADGKVNMDGPAPKAADGKPDLSGTWAMGGGGGGRGQAREQLSLDDKPFATFANIGAGFKEGLPLKPEAAAVLKQRRADNSKDNPDVWCLPLGNQQFNTHPFPRKIIQNPGVTLILYETHMGLRQIFTDGRPLPNNDPQPWFYGYSVGRWEGDTLVVETIGFKDGGWLDINGSPLSDQAKTIERFRRPTYGAIEVEQTVDDPKNYTRPFTTKISWRLMPDTEIMEMVCTENNQSIKYIAPPASN